MSLLEEDPVAERIAAVLLERKKIGDQRRTQQQAYQRLNGERALARHYRRRGQLVGQQAESRTGHPKSPPQPICDIHSDKMAGVRSTLSFRWNSSSGSTTR
jgi:hypothetical protein